ncbi:MAG: SGNH/GDSL hydrolase family protein [Candidatus Pacebacteria bacterium]|nr:SGNH/GDSL hydrolase family protein [Candidatus Paceibacterota bacterium]
MKGNSKIKIKSFLKKLAFALIPLLILLVLAETGSRFIYYEKTGKNKGYFALQAVFRQVKFQILAKKANQVIGGLPKDKDLWRALYSETGKTLLSDFQNKYEENFKLLVDEAKKIDSKVVVLYLIGDAYQTPAISAYFKPNRQFFSQLAAKYQVDFLDLTDVILKYPQEQITLLPLNGHLSRFGNQLVAEELGKYLEKFQDYKATFHFEKRPKILGDLSPSDNSVWEIDPKMPYQVITNKQGLRIDYDLVFPKQKQRILVLGDSFTFGPFLSNQDTYPFLLNEKYPDKEVINAGVAGYTIADEAPLFLERAQYTEPDIVVLQVLDNDLPDFFSYKRNQFNRKKINVLPSKAEVNFFEQLKK